MMRALLKQGGSLLIVAALVVGCGKVVDATSQQSNQDTGSVSGVGGFGSQCPYGTLSDPQPVALNAAGCSESSPFQLAHPLLPITLQGDCKKMEIVARTTSGSRIESGWNVLPDGRFSFTMDSGVATLGKDSAGQVNCQTPTTLDVTGLMKCSDRDHAQIEIDATWHVGQSMPGTESHLTGTACKVEPSCTLHGFTTLKQCGG